MSCLDKSFCGVKMLYPNVMTSLSLRLCCLCHVLLSFTVIILKLFEEEKALINNFLWNYRLRSDISKWWGICWMNFVILSFFGSRDCWYRVYFYNSNDCKRGLNSLHSASSTIYLCTTSSINIEMQFNDSSFCSLQVIALNSSQAAEGWLYVDDGKSFEFQRGAYIHRHFIYSDGKLSSYSNMASTGFGKFSSECMVERIILLGFSPGTKKALIEPANEKVDIELGPLLLQGGLGSSVLTIRKPNVRVTDDWTIKIL